jgi:hypothetical protein
MTDSPNATFYEVIKLEKVVKGIIPSLRRKPESITYLKYWILAPAPGHDPGSARMKKKGNFGFSTRLSNFNPPFLRQNSWIPPYAFLL